VRYIVRLRSRSQKENPQTTLNDVIKTYRSGAQEDAHEYAVNLLDYLVRSVLVHLRRVVYRCVWRVSKCPSILSHGAQHRMAVEVIKKKYNLSKAMVQKHQNWQLSSSIYNVSAQASNDIFALLPFT